MSRVTLLKEEVWLGEGGDRALLRFGKSPETGYPPYNLELLTSGEGEPQVLRITIAVAGFSLAELSVTLEGDALLVCGQQKDERERDFLYRGIAARRFKRSFTLAAGVEVRKAELHNGLLSIEIERPVANKDVRTVPIATRDRGERPEAARLLPTETVSDAE